MRIKLLAALAFCALPACANAAVTVTIDKSAQLMTVEHDGRPLYQWPVSTGKAGYDTPNGKFKAFRMERDHFSKEWDDAPMPFSIFFTQKGHAIHGSLDTKRLGSPASHGCVRLLPANAEKLFELVKQDGVLNTTVILTGVAPSGAPCGRQAPSAAAGRSRRLHPAATATAAAALWAESGHLRPAAGLRATAGLRSLLCAAAIPVPRAGTLLRAAAIRPVSAARLRLPRSLRRAVPAAPRQHLPVTATA